MYTVCGHIMSCRHVDEEEGYSSMYQSCKSIPILICFFVRTGGVTQQDLLDKLGHYKISLSQSRCLGTTICQRCHGTMPGFPDNGGRMVG